MRFTYEEIKQELKEHLDELSQDNLSEWADGFIPVYYSDILKDWQEMPSEFDNRWKDDTDINEDTTIYSLMMIDLFWYYLDQCESAYKELLEEAEETEDN